MIKWMNPHVRKRAALLAAILILLAGIAAVFKMDEAVYHDQPLPGFIVQTQAPGMLPFDVNEQVTMPLEEAIRGLGEIEKITSVSRLGFSQINVKVKTGDLKNWKDRLEQRIQAVSRQLPVGPQNVRLIQENLQSTELGYYLLHGADLQTLRDVAEFQVKNRLAQISGVSKIEIEAESVENKLEIVFRPSMLQTYGVTPDDIAGQLQGQGEVSPIGEVGNGSDKTYMEWVNQPANPEEVGKIPIATDKGYVLLKRLADIRDLRGSQSEHLSLYKGEPYIGIRIFGQAAGRALDVQSQVTKTIDLLNQEAQGRYRLTLFENQVGILSKELRDMGLFVGLAVLFAAVIIAFWMRQTAAGILSILGVKLTVAWMLLGFWLYGTGLDLVSVGLSAIIAFLSVSAGIALFFRYRQLDGWTQASIDQVTRRTLIPLVAANVCLAILMLPLLYTDFIKSADKAAFYLAIPAFLWGLIGLVIAYALFIPTVSGMWLTEAKKPAVRPRLGKMSKLIANKWKRICELRYMPYAVSLAATILIAVFCKPFVITQPFTELITNQMDLALEMVEGSTLEMAFKAEKQAEEGLRKFPEIQDMYATISKEEITLHLKLVDRYDRTRSKGQFDKALKKLFLEVKGTKNYALTDGEAQDEQVEFTVKGPSLADVKALADQLAYRIARYPWLTRLPYNDPFITEVKTSYEGKFKQINFRPRADVLARYNISEAAVKSQIKSYLEERFIGQARWGEKSTSIMARFPESAMQHPDQIQNLLVRTPQGAVALKDLAEWEMVPSAEEFQREDGMYVIKVSGKVNQEFTTAEQVYAALPRIKEYITVPIGCSLLTGEDVRKQEKEKAEEKDLASRVLITGLTLFLCLLVSAFGLRRVTPAVCMLLLLPLFAASSILGLLIVDRPLSMMSMFGLIAVVGLTLEHGFLFISQLEDEEAFRDDALPDDAVGRVTRFNLQPVGAVLIAGFLAILPLAWGWGGREDFHAPFAATFSFGILLAVWILLGLLPGLYPPLAKSSLHQTLHHFGKLKQQIGIWWINERIKWKDSRAMRQMKRENQEKYVNDAESKTTQEGKRTAELSPDDFLPLIK